MKKVLILIEPGFEEVEALTPVDLLRRAGALVTMATSITTKQVAGKSGIMIICDKTHEEVLNEKYDMIVLPGGGGGVENLRKNTYVLRLVQNYYKDSQPIGAICAAPLVLKEAGILNQQNLTSYPSTKPELEALVQYSEDNVVVDGSLITSRGPGTAVEFSLKLIEQLLGKDKSDEIKNQVVA